MKIAIGISKDDSCIILSIKTSNGRSAFYRLINGKRCVRIIISRSCEDIYHSCSVNHNYFFCPIIIHISYYGTSLNLSSYIFLEKQSSIVIINHNITSSSGRNDDFRIVIIIQISYGNGILRTALHCNRKTRNTLSISAIDGI